MDALAKKKKVQLAKDIFPGEVWELILKNRGGDDLVVIDVSTPREYENLHLEGAVNVNLFSRFFKARLDAMDKTYCKYHGYAICVRPNRIDHRITNISISPFSRSACDGSNIFTYSVGSTPGDSR